MDKIFHDGGPYHIETSPQCSLSLSTFGRVKPPTKFSKRRGLTGPQFLEGGGGGGGGGGGEGGGGGGGGGWGERGGGCNCKTKRKLKSRIFNDKKSL